MSSVFLNRAVEEFTRNASGWEETVFVEPDPCRNKEDDKDPLYESSGLWGQAFDNQWAIKRVGYEEKKFPQWLTKSPAAKGRDRGGHRHRTGLVSSRYFA